MFPQRQIHFRSPLLAFAAACTVLGLAWVVDAAIAPTTWMARLTLLMGGLLLTGLTLRLRCFGQSSADENALRYIKLLCELDLQRLEGEADFNAETASDKQNPWYGVYSRVRETLLHYARALERAEHQRAGAEVRAQRLLMERDQLQEILAGLADPVLAVDSSGQIVVHNPSATRLLGLSSAAGEHPALSQLARCTELIDLLSETRRRKCPSQRSAEVSIGDETGRQHAFRIHCRTLAGSQEDVAGERAMQSAVAVFTDITGLKAIQKRNAEFVSAVSHEMKTPLSSIRAYVELLADGDAEDEQTREEFFEVINSQTERLQRLIDNLLNLARIEAGVVSVNKAPRSLNELLQEAVNVLQPAADQKNITLTTEFSPLYLGVLADRDTLLQAAINLMSNALKYTRPGGSVTVRSQLSDQHVQFEVSDSGVGLSPEDSRKVFEKFYRVKKDREMASGTGLGLPLVKHIVEDVHGGRIEVESELGQGSTFRIVLPSSGQLSA